MASSTTGNGAESATGVLEELARLRQRVTELERELTSARQAQRGYIGFAEREALLRQAERDAQMGSWIWDVTTDEVYWSPELYRILGYDPARDKPSVEGFFAALHPYDVDTVRTASRRAVATGLTPMTEARVVQRSGEVRYLLIAGLALRDSEGNTLRIVGTVLDVTDRREAEQRLRQSELLLNEAQRMAHLGSCTWDVASRTISGSDEFYRVLGFDPQTGTLPVADVLQRVHAEDVARVKAAVGKLAAAPGEDSGSFRLTLPDGTVRRVVYSARPLANPSGRLAYVGTIMDITERSQLEEQLRQAQKMEAVGRLAGGVAHDFNNLLTVIMAYTEILLKEAPSYELRAIETAAAAAADLTRRLLTFSRQAVIQPVVLDLNEVLEGAMMLLSRTLGEDIHLERSQEPSLGLITADAGQAHQVLLNLAVNARDAMPNGGTLTIRTANVTLDAEFTRKHSNSKPGPYVLLEVSDTGTGMDEYTQSRIFEPFFTTKTPEKGTGLGLSTVFGIVNQSGGAIEVTSAIGRGTTFRVYFPHEARGRPISAPPTPRPESRPFTGSVLVVEDSAQVADLVTRVLSDAGYKVLSARGFADAVRLWNEDDGQVALVLTDVVMTDGNGADLVRHLRTDRPDLAVLYMSGYARGTGSAELLDGPYLAKPFSADELLAKVEEARSFAH